MSDRSYVRITVPKWAVSVLAALQQQGYSPDEVRGDGATWEFFEARGGEAPVEGNLRAAFVPYDTRWEAGAEYSSGSKEVRFSKTGEIKTGEHWEGDDTIAAQEILDLWSKDPKWVLAKARQVAKEARPLGPPLDKCKPVPEHIRAAAALREI